MIIKKMTNEAPTKSKAVHISDILDYIDDIIEDFLEDKVLFSNSLNLNSKEHDSIKEEMILLANKSKSKNPVDHILISFHKEDVVTEEQINESIKMLLDDLGYQGCQTSYAVHHNTDNLHVHICINRVDPETFLVRPNFYDVEKMHKSISRMENKYGWRSEEKSRYAVVDGEVIRTRHVSKNNEVCLSDKARSFEIRQGEKSMQRICAENVLPVLESSKSWPEIHERLALLGISYEKKGGGAILRSRIEGKIVEVKPSDLAPWAALKHMEKKIDSAYVVSKVAVPPREAEPMEGVPPKILDEYKKQKRVNDNRQLEYEEFEREKELLKNERKRVLEIITSPQDWSQKSLALAALHKASNEKYKEEMNSLVERYKEKFEHNKKIIPSVTNFEVWLKKHNPEQSEQILQSIVDAPARIVVPTHLILTEKDKQKQLDFERYHNAVRAERYRVSCRGEILDKKTGKPKKVCLILDRDKKTNITNGFKPEQVIENIPLMSKYEQKGEHIYYTPLSDTKHHLFIDDLTKSSLEKIKKDGLRPSCVIESSNGNFQAIFTLPKLCTDNDKNIVNDMASGLNIIYGDVCFSGAIHPHRAPGFENTKKEHMKDGAYPIVKIVEASGEECSVLKSYMSYLDDFLNYQKKKPKSKQTYITKSDIKIDHKNMDQFLKIYMAHRDSVIKYSGIPESALDGSRLDAMIAVRLRGTGHSKENIVAILESSGQATRGTTHDWGDYAQRTLDYAFGAEGSQMLDKYKYYIKQWKSLESLAVGQTAFKARMSEDVAQSAEMEIKSLETPAVAHEDDGMTPEHLQKSNKKRESLK